MRSRCAEIGPEVAELQVGCYRYMVDITVLFRATRGRYDSYRHATNVVGMIRLRSLPSRRVIGWALVRTLAVPLSHAKAAETQAPQIGLHEGGRALTEHRRTDEAQKRELHDH